jgi:DNA-binding NtrC family response regulator
MFRAVVLSEGDSLGLAEFPQIAAQVPTQSMAEVPSPTSSADDPQDTDLDEAELPPADSPSEAVLVEASPTERLIAAQSSALLDALALLDEAGEVRPLEEIESELIRYAITHYRGQMSEVARRLRIGRSTLYRKLETLGLNSEQPESDSDGVAAERQPRKIA